MNKYLSVLAGFVLILLSKMVSAAPDPNFYIFLCIGQSNMVGMPQPQPQDTVTIPRVKVLGFSTCGTRTYDVWATAKPPLHDCGAGLGPGDYFGKTLADSFPGKTIGLVPLAISGAGIELWMKDTTYASRSSYTIPPDNHWSGAYPWMIERAQLAQQSGIIKGIIFHQGEANTGESTWPAKVKKIVTNLRTDLGIGNVPFLAGELLYPPSCCGQWHNPLIDALPAQIPNSWVVSAKGLTEYTADGLHAHFDLPSQRQFGTWYADSMLIALRKIATGVAQNCGHHFAATQSAGSRQPSVLFSIDGRVVANLADTHHAPRHIRRGLYLIQNADRGQELFVLP